MLLLLGYYEHLAAMNINVPVLTWICVFISLWYIPWNKKVEYYDNSIFISEDGRKGARMQRKATSLLLIYNLAKSDCLSIIFLSHKPLRLCGIIQPLPPADKKTSFLHLNIKMYRS